MIIHDNSSNGALAEPWGRLIYPLEKPHFEMEKHTMWNGRNI
jgi:hypothetical protein